METILDKSKQLKYFDSNKFELRSFVPQGQTESVSFFGYKGDMYRTVPSRSYLWGQRVPFEVAPEIQILIDEAAAYGTRVDNEIEQTILGEAPNLATASSEVLDTIRNIALDELVWVDRSVMICHPDGLASGEIDELLYHPPTDTYFIGDTKTSSSVHKASYAWQIALYAEILRELNPGVKISSIGIINHVKYKYFKWMKNSGESASQPSAKKVDSTHPRYNALWTKGETFETPELVKRDLFYIDLNSTDSQFDHTWPDGEKISMNFERLVKAELNYLKAIKTYFPNIPQLKDIIANMQTREFNEQDPEDLKLLARINAKLQEFTMRLIHLEADPGKIGQYKAELGKSLVTGKPV